MAYVLGPPLLEVPCAAVEQCMASYAGYSMARSTIVILTALDLRGMGLLPPLRLTPRTNGCRRSPVLPFEASYSSASSWG
jgi:hypothetical protein